MDASTLASQRTWEGTEAWPRGNTQTRLPISTLQLPSLQPWMTPWERRLSPVPQGLSQEGPGVEAQPGRVKVRLT